MIDSHCHLADDAFVPDLAEVIGRAKSAGLTGALCILDPTNPEEAARFKQVVALWPSARCATGIHPHQAGKFRDRVDEVEQFVADAIAGSPQSCAVGEIGLDYHYDFAPREVQQEVFRRQVRFACEKDLPVVIHTREADDDTGNYPFAKREAGRSAVCSTVSQGTPPWLGRLSTLGSTSRSQGS